MSGGTNGKHEPVVGYLERVEIENVRSIASLTWEVTPAPGWNVILGDNGTGKSTFLRLVSYSFMPIIRQLLASLYPTFEFQDRVGAPSGRRLEIRIQVQEEGGRNEHEWTIWEDGMPGEGISANTHGVFLSFDDVFVAGFGPFRRLTGGDGEYPKQVTADPSIARNLSLFDERVSSVESLTWLKLLRFKELEEDAASSTLLRNVHAFINQEGFLPNGVRLERITSDHVFFVDGNGADIPIDELSDGYRSILSLTLELIRHLAAHYGADRVFNASSTAVVAPGIVLIDEIDAHLHPSWQRQIGLTLRKQFPNIQWVVATHSPLICQAATAETDTVYRLPRPGTDEGAHKVTGAELGRLLYGDLADAYGTDAMGHIGRSEKAYVLLDQLARLNRKEIDAGLTDEEQQDQRRLRRIFGSGPLPERRP